MPYRKSKPWGPTKPPVGARIDWGDPITLALRYAYLLNEASNAQIFDAVSPLHGGSVGVTNLPSISKGPFGGARNFVQANNEYYKTSAIPTLGLPFTLGIWFRLNASGWNVLASHQTASSNNGWRIETNDNLGFTSSAFTLGGVADYQTGVSVSTGVWYLGFWSLSAAVSGSLNVTIWQLDNLAFLQDTTQTLGTMSGTPNEIAIGGTSAFTTISANADISHVYIWNRLLSKTEKIRLLTEPFAGIVAPRRRIISGAAVGSTLAASGTSTASFAGASNAAASLSASGASSASFVGAAQDAATLAAAGSSSASFVGAPAAAAALSATGTSTASFAGATGGSVMSASGDSSASFVGASNVLSSFIANANSNAIFVPYVAPAPGFAIPGGKGDSGRENDEFRRALEYNAMRRQMERDSRDIEDALKVMMDFLSRR